MKKQSLARSHSNSHVSKSKHKSMLVALLASIGGLLVLGAIVSIVSHSTLASEQESEHIIKTTDSESQETLARQSSFDDKETNKEKLEEEEWEKEREDKEKESEQKHVENEREEKDIEEKEDDDWDLSEDFNWRKRQETLHNEKSDEPRDTEAAQQPAVAESTPQTVKDNSSNSSAKKQTSNQKLLEESITQKAPVIAKTPQQARSQLNLETDHDQNGIVDSKDSDPTKNTDSDNDGIDDAYDDRDDRPIITRFLAWLGII